MSRVPPHASPGSDPPSSEELEQLEELGDDAIIAQQRGAHAPAPRAQVTEEARSVVISDHPPGQSSPPPQAKIPRERSSKTRSERSEQTVVIRDRRQLEELRRAMAKHKPGGSVPPEPGKGLLLWVIVGAAAFLVGGLVALFATRPDAPATLAKPAGPAVGAPSAVPLATVEPPSISIDSLPIEGRKKK